MILISFRLFKDFSALLHAPMRETHLLWVETHLLWVSLKKPTYYE